MPPAVSDQVSLFDTPAATPPAPAAAPRRLTADLAASRMWKQQVDRAAGIKPGPVLELVEALLHAPGRQLSLESAAAALGVPATDWATRGALSQAKRLLNVEQYPVLSQKPGTNEVVLDRQLLAEQFGITL